MLCCLSSALQFTEEPFIRLSDGLGLSWDEFYLVGYHIWGCSGWIWSTVKVSFTTCKYFMQNLQTMQISVHHQLSIICHFFIVLGDGQVDFNEFMTILGPKLLSSETREGFLGSTIDTIFWQVRWLYSLKHLTLLSHELNWIWKNRCCVSQLKDNHCKVEQEKKHGNYFHSSALDLDVFLCASLSTKPKSWKAELFSFCPGVVQRSSPWSAVLRNCVQGFTSSKLRCNSLQIWKSQGPHTPEIESKNIMQFSY